MRGVLGVEGVVGPKAELLAISSSLVVASTSSSGSGPPSHAGEESSY